MQHETVISSMIENDSSSSDEIVELPDSSNLSLE